MILCKFLSGDETSNLYKLHEKCREHIKDSLRVELMCNRALCTVEVETTRYSHISKWLMYDLQIHDIYITVRYRMLDDNKGYELWPHTHRGCVYVPEHLGKAPVIKQVAADLFIGHDTAILYEQYKEHFDDVVTPTFF